MKYQHLDNKNFSILNKFSKFASIYLIERLNINLFIMVKFKHGN